MLARFERQIVNEEAFLPLPPGGFVQRLRRQVMHLGGERQAHGAHFASESGGGAE